MGELKKIDTKGLNAAIAEVNELEVEGIENIRVVGISNVAKARLFIIAVAGIGKVDEKLLSDSVIAIYNELPNQQELSDIEAASGKKSSGKKGTAKKKKEPKEKKEPKPKSRYGHILSAKSGRLDDALFEGGTMGDIMEALDIPRARFVGHANHLKNDLGLTLVITADKDKEKLKDHYKIKEESLEKK